MTFVSIGCAADANPFPRRGVAYSRQHGEDIATEVNRLLSGHFTELSGDPVCRLERIALPFDTLPSREEWHEKEAEDGPVGYHAGKWLERIGRGETAPTTHSYPIQTWTFGDDLTMVFLTGEVVADYTLHLRRLYDPAKLWIGAYANDFPGYIPSRRVWQEGGYEGGWRCPIRACSSAPLSSSPRPSWSRNASTRSVAGRSRIIGGFCVAPRLEP